MATTARPTTNASAPRDGRPSLAEARSARRRRRVAVAVAGLVVFGAAVIAFADLEPRSPRAVAVLVAARPLTAGHAIAEADLRVALVTAQGVATLPAAGRARVVGRAAALDVAAGAPLVAGDVGAVPGPGSGQAVVGLALRAGQVPVGLRPGDSVAVLATPRGATASSTAPVPAMSARPPAAKPGAGGLGDVLATGRVWSVGPAEGATVLGVLVSADAAAGVATAAAADGVSVVWVSR